MFRIAASLDESKGVEAIQAREVLETGVPRYSRRRLWGLTDEECVDIFA